jgi:hypothetical protein
MKELYIELKAKQNITNEILDFESKILPDLSKYLITLEFKMNGHFNQFLKFLKKNKKINLWETLFYEDIHSNYYRVVDTISSNTFWMQIFDGSIIFTHCKNSLKTIISIIEYIHSKLEVELTIKWGLTFF